MPVDAYPRATVGSSRFGDMSKKQPEVSSLCSIRIFHRVASAFIGIERQARVPVQLRAARN
eukprot:scaffold73396_cov18-Tisochrysis_lutea.AAC.1